MSRFRQYRLYFYISEEGNIYETDYSKVYQSQQVRGGVIVGGTVIVATGAFLMLKFIWDNSEGW